MDERDAAQADQLIHAAQADQLIRALLAARAKAIRQMTRLDSRASPLDVASLRRDVNEAETHITLLQRRYLLEGRSAPQRGQ